MAGSPTHPAATPSPLSSSGKVSIFITGCSPGGTGAALAVAFHEAGHHVYASARDPAKLAPLVSIGIHGVTLDITSQTSIESAVSEVSSSLPDGQGLDILVNNAGGSVSMPVVDLDLQQARALFDTNVWGQIAVTQAFLPLLLKAAKNGSRRPVIANHSSIGAVIAMPIQGAYNASKAAFSMLSSTLRQELAPFGISVVEIKTAAVGTNIFQNSNVHHGGDHLPTGSIYWPARDIVTKALEQEHLKDQGQWTPERWAAKVMSWLLKRNPQPVLWTGGQSTMAWAAATFFPDTLTEGMMSKMVHMDLVAKRISEGEDGRD